MHFELNQSFASLSEIDDNTSNNDKNGPNKTWKKVFFNSLQKTMHDLDMPSLKLSYLMKVYIHGKATFVLLK